MKLSSIRRLQMFARMERLDHLIDVQTARLRLAEKMGWPTQDANASLRNLLQSRDLYRQQVGLRTDAEGSAASAETPKQS